MELRGVQGLGMGLGMDQHPVFGPVKFKVRELGNDPDSQVAQTIGVMREKVAEDSADPGFRDRAEGVIGNARGRAAVEKIWEHAARGIQFQRDELTGSGVGGYDSGEIVEVIVRPKDIAGYMDAGKAVEDCDGFSMYCAALLTAVGIPCSFVTVGASSAAPDQYSHVYVVAYPDGERVPCDASHGAYCGWEVGNPYGKYAEWPVYDRVRMMIGNVVTGAAVLAGLWFGWKWVKGEFAL